MMDEPQTPRKRGKPRKYKDALELGREMKKRRSERFKSMGWSRPNWWIDKQIVTTMRLAKQPNETMDELANRLINVVVDHSDIYLTRLATLQERPISTAEDEHGKWTHTPRLAGSRPPIHSGFSGQMEFEF